MYRKLFPTIDRSLLILTANSRLSRHLQHNFSLYQANNGFVSWPSANIIPLSSWLISQWQNNPQAHGKLLTDSEELILWQTIISSDSQASQLLQINNTAKLIKQAWQTIKLWQAPLQDICQSNDEIIKFFQWAEKFEQIKQTNNLLSTAELPHEIEKLISNNQLELKKRIILTGFDDFPPALQSLITTLSQHAEVSEFDGEDCNQNTQRIALETTEIEITSMAQWAKNKLGELKPNQQIGCIIPDLNGLRKTVQRIFTEQFNPKNNYPGQEKQALEFNISSGESLSKVLMIKTALNILSLRQKTDKEILSSVLLSPYVCEQEEDLEHAAMIQDRLKDYSAPSSKNTSLFQAYHDCFQDSTIATRWNNFFTLKLSSGTQTCQHWGEQFKLLLNTLNWPGNRTLDSYEYQAMARWQLVLEEFTNLDQLLPPVSYQQALNLLRQLCQNTLFQPQTKDTPIQVLGLLEASGSHFTHLWLMGLNEDNWPPKAAPNPFLPMELQRQKNMPHATAAREHQYCINIQEKLFKSSDFSIASYALREEDRERHPSPLITAIQTTTWQELGLNTLDTSSRQQSELEEITDQQGPAILDKEEIRGGSSLLQNQSLCPFRAFASHRLNAEPLQTDQIGLNAADRGINTHRVLELIWQQLSDQQTLLNSSSEDLNQLIKKTVAQTCNNNPFQSDLYWNVEKQRLENLIGVWLTLEKQRPAFTVDKRETKRHIQIGPLSLKIQIDRIDTLENGEQLIIDYKTNSGNNINTWFGGRPEHPQLPLYSLFNGKQTCGLAYAEVSFSSLKYKGIIKDDATFSKMLGAGKALGKEKTLKMQQNIWYKTLTQLAEQFHQGDAGVDPLNEKACQYCAHHALCRIGESA